MNLENCCYDFFEMAALNMAQQGLFGESTTLRRLYSLSCRRLGFSETWRIDYNMASRGQLPDARPRTDRPGSWIFTGDSFDYLVAMDTPSYNGKKAAKRYRDSEECLDGDHTISLIRTGKGKLVEVQHNVYAPRPYTRMYQLTGTEGFANKYPSAGIAVKSINGHDYVAAAGHGFAAECLQFDFVKEIEEKARLSAATEEWTSSWTTD